MTPNLFSVLFLISLLLATGLQVWLKTRHIRHVVTHRNAVPAAFAAAINLESHQRAADYTIAKARFARAHALYEAAVLLALTLGGGIEALNRLAQHLAGPGMAGGLLLLALVLLVQGVLDLPWSVWATFRLEARFGFNKTTPALFISDLLKGVVLGGVLGLPLAAAVLYFLQVAGDGWWLAVWLVWVGFSLLLMAVFPTWIAPLFNRFVPLDQPELKARIEGLLGRCGFQSNGVFVMDGSRRSSHGNAYFTGFGRTKRIVFFDTLIERLAGEEVEAVLAHELGHFAHRHVLKRMLTTFGLALLVLFLAAQLHDASWFYAGLGVPVGSDAVFLLLVMLVFPLWLFPLGWIGSRVSRRHEFEADQYAARHASAAALITGLVKLYQDNAATLTPDPLHSLFFDSHPPAALRIAALRAS